MSALTLKQAQMALTRRVTPIDKVLCLPLQRARGLVVSKAYDSTLAIPPENNSAMDGFALRAQDVNKRGSTQHALLSISQRIPAGGQPQKLEPGTAARIFTGAVVPPGADAVVIQEHCEYDDASVRVCADVRVGDNIRPRGQDIKPGACVAAKGKKLSAVDLSLLASVGVAKVEVFKPLTVAIFSTGDELAEPGRPLAYGQIYNSNRPLLIGLCEQLGYQVYDCGVVEDTLQATCDALGKAAEQADFIISSGGVSVGEEDHVKPAIESLGELDLWKIQIKPGKPVAFGQVANTPFLGLPGNPVSSFVVFQLIGQLLLATRQGERYQAPLEYPVVAAFNKKMSQREEYIRVKIERDEHGQLSALPFGNLSSGVMSSLSWADGLVRQNANSAIVSGQLLAFLPIKNGLL